MSRIRSRVVRLEAGTAAAGRFIVAIVAHGCDAVAEIARCGVPVDASDLLVIVRKPVLVTPLVRVDGRLVATDL